MKFALNELRDKASALLVLCVCFAARADQASPEDPVVRAMRDELSRSVDHLQLADAGKPYYFALELNDTSAVFVNAAFGAIIGRNENKSRYMRADVRVGDYTLDSSNMGRRSGTSIERLPIDNDYDVVRHDTWHAFDEAYKQAAAAYARKMAMRESLAQNPDEVADFSRETPSHIAVKRDLPRVDAERAASLVKELSSFAKKFPAIQASDVRFLGASGRQVVLSSEGTFATENDSLVTVGVVLRAQAPDGMPLTRFQSFAARTLDGLPDKTQLTADIERVATELSALRDAEQAQDYTGPVLFEGDAAPQLLTHVLAPQFSGTPAPKSEAGRGGSSSESELAGKLGQRVLPPGFSVVDDPTLDQIASLPLLGRYAVDSEGMPAQRVALVQDGMLQDFLMSRTPRKNFLHSNGHGQGGMYGPVRGAIGNLILTTNKGLTKAELYKRLLAEAKAAGQSYALIVRGIDDPMASGDFFSMMRRGSNVPPPSVLVRLSADGKEQPLRGGTFGALPLAAFEDIVATGQELAVANQTMGHVTSVASPALLFKRVELRKPAEQQRKLPVLTHPYFEAKTP